MADDMRKFDEGGGREQQIEHVAMSCIVEVNAAGRFYLRFEGLFFPSLPNKQFGLTLRPETTK